MASPLARSLRRALRPGGAGREWALVAAILAALSLIWLWPLPSAPTRLTPTEPDLYLTNWHQLWMAWLLRAEDLRALLGLRTGLINAPAGVDLRYLQEWLTAGASALLSLPLELLGFDRLRALTAGQNLGLAVAWVSSGLATYALGRDLGGPAGGGAAAAAVLSSAALRSQAVMACPEFLWLGAVALSLRALLRAPAQDPAGGARAGLAAGGWAALSGLGTRYLLVGAGAWLGLALVAGLLARRRGLVAAAGAALAIAGPAALFLGWPQLTGGSGDGADVLRGLPSLPAPSALFLPASVYNPEMDPAWEPHTWSIYLGWALPGLGAAGAVRGGWRARLLFAGGLAGLLAAMGWQTPGGATLPMGYAGRLLPVLENLHAPSRLVVLAQLGFAGAGAALFAGKGRAAALAGVVCVVEGLFAARGLFPFPTAALPALPAALEAQLAGASGVLELSLDSDWRSSYHDDNHMEARQIRHGLPLYNFPAWPGGAPSQGEALLEGVAVDWLAEFFVTLPEPPPPEYVIPIPGESPLVGVFSSGVDLVLIAAPPAGRLHACAVTGAAPSYLLRCAAHEGANR